MTFDIFLFYLFSMLALFSAFFTVTSKNPIHSVLFLVFVFFNTAGLLILLGVEFLAMLFLIVCWCSSGIILICNDDAKR